MHWEGTRRIPPQGGPHNDRAETKAGTIWGGSVPLTGGGNGGGGPEGSGDLCSKNSYLSLNPGIKPGTLALNQKRLIPITRTRNVYFYPILVPTHRIFVSGLHRT